jgi:iron-regulated transporter 1
LLVGIRLTKSERKILVGRFLTRAGDQAWDFVLPLTLASVFPERIALIALFYLLSKVGTVFLQPWALGIIDKWNRLSAARCGLLVQAFSVILICLCLWIFQTGNEQFDAHASGQPVEDHQLRFYLFGACMVLGSVASTLGSGLLEVAVGNDWLPVIAARERLVHVNSCLKQVDLFTEVTAPIAAGAVLAWLSPSGALLGLGVIASWNLISFLPEFYLLRSVFLETSALREQFVQQPRTGGGFIKALIAGWSEFVKHPAALSMTAFALLWLSVLSPHGVLLTSFLKSERGISETALGIWRGFGALFGVIATLLFPYFVKQFGLLPSARVFVFFQAGTVLAAAAFFLLGSNYDWYFFGAVLLSRIGLYGFSIGESEIRQCSISEGQRGRINGVAQSLTTIATLTLYCMGSVLSGNQSFFCLVLLSACSVTAAAAVFWIWSRGRSVSSVSS